MSLTLKIDRTEKTPAKLAEYLEEVAKVIEKGNLIGEDWDIEGQRELEDEPEDYDDDF